MRILSAALILFLSFSAFSQEGIQNFYKKYMTNEKMTNVNLSGWVLNMAAQYADEGKEKEMLQKITKLRVMIMEDGNLVTKSDYSSLIKDIKKDDFEPFMNIKEGKEKIDLYLRDDGETITNVLVMVNGEDEFVLLSLEGNLKFSDLNDINFDVEGGDIFKKIPEQRKSIPRA
ncbi:MAG: DUF4252 domain-containing protein [Bacteroidetes bacterium]|jgi:hypothetical protein|nr:DUF4252 domain-containing protein [Bacteroidota bacterium]MDF1865569.1 DUF4252 domain-containing protein [Saprospiraceae bacterium]